MRITAWHSATSSSRSPRSQSRLLPSCQRPGPRGALAPACEPLRTSRMGRGAAESALRTIVTLRKRWMTEEREQQREKGAARETQAPHGLVLRTLLGGVELGLLLGGDLGHAGRGFDGLVKGRFHLCNGGVGTAGDGRNVAHETLQKKIKKHRSARPIRARQQALPVQLPAALHAMHSCRAR